MQLRRKFISLLCAMAMICSLFSGITVMAEGTDGVTLKLVESTDTKIVLDVEYSGFDAGMQTIGVEIPIPAELVANVESEVTGGFDGTLVGYNKRTGALTIGGSKVAGMKDADKKVATITINLASKLESDLVLEPNVVKMTDMDGVMHSLTAEDEALKLTTNSVTVEAIEEEIVVTEGVVISVDKAKSTASKIVLDVSYVGFDAGMQTIGVEIPIDAELVANVESEITSGFDGTLVGYNKRTGALTIGGSKVAGMKDPDKKVATITINLTKELTGKIRLQANVVKMTDMDGVMHSLTAEDEALKLQTNFVKYDPNAVAETEIPEETEVPATQDPNTTAEPTKIPTAPRPTAMPTKAPAETAKPTDEPVVINEGIIITVDKANSTASKIVLDVTYAGFDAGMQTIGVEIPIPAELVANVESEITSGFDGTLVGYNKRTGALTIGGSKVAGMKDPDKKVATITINLTKNLEESIRLEANVVKMTDMDGVMHSLTAEDEALKLQTNYVVYDPNEPIPTDTPEPTDEPEPTATPKPAGEIELEDILSVEKAKEAEAAGKTTYVTFTATVTEEDGTVRPAVYGVDYVAKDANGNILTEEEFFNSIWGYNMSASNAIDTISIVAYNPNLKIEALLNAEGDENVVDDGSHDFAKPAEPTPKPTDKPGQAKFAAWSPKTLVVTRTQSKSSTVRFTNVPVDVETKISFDVVSGDNVEIASETDAKAVGKGVVEASVSVQAIKAKSDKAYVEATLTYTYEGEDFKIVSDKLQVNTSTSSNNNNKGGGGSYSGASGGIIAGGNTGAAAPGLVWGNATNAVYFQDLDQAPWAEAAIKFLAERGIVNGRSLTAFEPMGEITRAEFAKLVVTIYGINVGEGIQATVYPDVVGGEWYTPYVNAAAQYGIVTGYPDGMFRPNNLVSRQEMAVMMYRAITTFATQLPAINGPKAWSDEIPDWSAPAINALQVAGVMNGVSETEFAPTAASTRAMAAQMIFNLYSVVVQ